MMEFLYRRYILDKITACFWLLAILGQLLLIVEVEGVPYSGTYPLRGDRDVLFFAVSIYSFILHSNSVSFFKYKIIDNIPFLKDEIQQPDSESVH